MGRAKQYMMEQEERTWLLELIKSGELAQPKLGIAKQVYEQGEDSLSEKQRYHYDQLVEQYHSAYTTCQQCSGEIPGSEIGQARENGGICGYCEHNNSKWD